MTTTTYRHATAGKHVLRLDHTLAAVLLVLAVAGLLALLAVAASPLSTGDSGSSGQVVAPGPVRTPVPRPAGY